MRVTGVAVLLGLALWALAGASHARAEQTVYVGGPAAGRVAALDIGGGGSLSAVSGSPFAAANGASALAMSPDGRLLYVSNTAANSISGYSVDASCALTALPGSPFSAPG